MHAEVRRSSNGHISRQISNAAQLRDVLRPHQARVPHYISAASTGRSCKCTEPRQSQLIPSPFMRSSFQPSSCSAPAGTSPRKPSQPLLTTPLQINFLCLALCHPDRPCFPACFLRMNQVNEGTFMATIKIFPPRQMAPFCLWLKKSLVVTFLIFPEEGAMPEKDHVKAHKTIHEHWYV